jgi:NADPH:quinone reductase-like Zn-dependent oxidoreductase
MVPGVDGVARAGDGRLLYFVTADELLGSMAERTLVDMRRTVALPEGTDPLRVAATMNPAMSSWVALRRRVPLARGQSVLILGATGNAGQMAVRIAKHLGAGRVVGAGRDPGRLAALSAAGADAVVQLVQDTAATSAALAEAAGDVDVVLDYLWGAPAASAMMTLARSRTDRSHALNWIQIGAIAGPTIELPSVAALGESENPGQRTGRRLARRLPGRATFAGRSDQRRRDCTDSEAGCARRCRGRMEDGRRIRRAHRL